MYCPRCGERQPLGSRQCANCGLPFTRDEAARRPRGARPVPAQGTASRARVYERDPGVGRRALTLLAVLVIAVVGAVAIAAILSRVVVRPFVGDTVTDYLRGRVGEAIATAVPKVTLPAGGQQVVLTEDELNRRIAERAGQLGPLQDARVAITPEEVRVDLSAYGVSGTYHAHVAAQNGQVVITDGRIDGPLGWVMPADQLQATLNQELATALNQSGVAVEQVTLGQGQATLTVAPRG